MRCNFEVGQDVVCVWDNWTTPEGTTKQGPNAPKVKDILQIKRILTARAYMDYWWPNVPFPSEYDDIVLLLFKEYGDNGFAANAFRSLRKTNIEQFKRLLVPQNSKIANLTSKFSKMGVSSGHGDTRIKAG